jgi:hypothetical protein
MKQAKILALTACLVTAALGSTAFINVKLLNKVNAEDKGFAVVELFTSEGCSSCPPADQLVAKIEKEIKDRPVYILAYHVDYWNRLGWKDAFSSADYSKRQQDYAAYLHIQSVYTPQIVVNGRMEFVGSEETVLRGAITGNLQKAQGSPLSLSAVTANKNQADIKYTTGKADKNTALYIAILQKNAQTKVGAGENSGRTLSHVQIVRKLQKVTLNSDAGETKVSLPPGFDSQNWEIIGFLQNTASGVLTGAARASFVE